MPVDREALNTIVENWLRTNGKSLKELDAVLEAHEVSARTFRQMRNSAAAEFSLRTINATAKALGVRPESFVAQPVAPQPFGSIAAPAPGSVLNGRQITVRGHAGNIPSGSTLWLVVAVGGLHWPKAPRYTQSGHGRQISSRADLPGHGSTCCFGRYPTPAQSKFANGFGEGTKKTTIPGSRPSLGSCRSLGLET